MKKGIHKKALLLLYLILTGIFIAHAQSDDPIWELKYDDGEPEDAFAWNNPGGRYAVKFYPALSHPLKIIGGSFYILSDWPSGQIIGSSLLLEVYNEDTAGYPGELLDSQLIEIDSTGWIEFSGLNILLPEGMFFISLQQMSYAPDCPGIGIDVPQGGYPPNMSYMRVAYSTDWTFGPYHNFMIRAVIDYAYEVGENKFELSGCRVYPNPFTTSTTIEYELTEPSHVQLSIYNAIGETIYVAEEGILPQGKHTFSWTPERLPEGMYYAVLRSEEGVSVVKMVKQ